MKNTRLLAIIAFLLYGGAAQAQFFDRLSKALDTLSSSKVVELAKDVTSAAKEIPETDEIEIGRDLAGRMLGQAPLLDNADVQAYVNRVGRWVASQSERPDLPWRFGVVNAKNVNAMAMPGGIILITQGLYDILTNEAELAAVLGHEIAHVVQKHHINVMRKQNWVSAGATVGGMYAASKGGGAMAQTLSNAGLGLFKDMFTSGLDKSSEHEADAIGVILAARAGYNAFGLADVLHKLHALSTKNDESVAFLFKTHPSPTDRIEKLGDLLTPRLSKLPQGLEPALSLR